MWLMSRFELEKFKGESCTVKPYYYIIINYYVIITSLLLHYSQLQKQVTMSSLLPLMHYPCFHYYIVITHYYHYSPLLYVTNWATCRWHIWLCSTGPIFALQFYHKMICRPLCQIRVMPSHLTSARASSFSWLIFFLQQKAIFLQVELAFSKSWPTAGSRV